MKKIRATKELHPLTEADSRNRSETGGEKEAETVVENAWDLSRSLLRKIPKVDFLLSEAPFRELISRFGEEVAVEQLRLVLEELRKKILCSEWITEAELSPEAIADECLQRLQEKERESLRPLINATGILLHTNLGRAALGRAVSEKVAAVAAGYCNLEYRIETGRRGSRHDIVETLLCQLTGAEAAMVVNNNAAAMLLMLAAFAKNREVIVSRGELVEIGGAFRIPDVMAESGAFLREVGTSNKTRVSDYEKAINENTAAILKVHRSNFRLEGFTEEASLRELKALAQKHKIPLFYDLGSGLLHPAAPEILKDEPTVRAAMEADCELSCFSGDKLLGGPQAGILVGRRALIEKMKQHQLARALRVDKLCLAALQEILKIYREPTRIDREIPFFAMLSETTERLERRADMLCDSLALAGIEAELCRLEAEIGGGSAPGVRLPSVGIALQVGDGGSLQRLERQLRYGDPAVISYIRNNELIFDLRSVREEEMESLLRSIIKAWRSL